jgi:hypothetical protein
VKAFAEEKLRTIYADFVVEADRAGSLCECGTFTYAGGNVPNYSNPLVQDAYLLRYLPAYLVEYWDIYHELIVTGFLGEDHRVASIGCGCGIDAWGLYFALPREGHHEETTLPYVGFDKVMWGHSAGPAGLNPQILIGDISRLKVLGGPYNVIMFPKSISEFSEPGVRTLGSILAATAFKQGRLALAASMMTEGRQSDEDRLRQLAEVMHKCHGYEIVDEMSLPRRDVADKYLGDLCSGFTYPTEMKKQVLDLHSRCGRARAQRGHCKDCSVEFRHPITTAKPLRSLTLLLERASTRRHP